MAKKIKRIMVSGYNPPKTKKKVVPQHNTYHGWYKDQIIACPGLHVSDEEWQRIFGKKSAT